MNCIAKAFCLTTYITRHIMYIKKRVMYMTLAEIRQESKKTSTREYDVLLREMEAYDPSEVSPELVKSQRALFETIIQPHTRKMYKKYLSVTE
jgi:hypothetical protein